MLRPWTSFSYLHSVCNLIQPHGIKCHMYAYDTQIWPRFLPLNSSLYSTSPLNIPTWVSNWHLNPSISQTGILSFLLNLYHPVFLIQGWWQLHFPSCSDQEPWSHPWLLCLTSHNILENVPISYHLGPSPVFPDCSKLSGFTSCALLVCSTVFEKP